MEIQDIINYVNESPCNTNQNVLGSMLTTLIEEQGGGSALYKHTINFGFGTLDWDPDSQYFGATVIINTNSQNPITTKEEFLETMSKFGPGSVDPYDGNGVYKTTSSYNYVGSVIIEKSQYAPSGYSVRYWGEYHEGDEYIESGVESVSLQVTALDFSITDTVTEIE